MSFCLLQDHPWERWFPNLGASKLALRFPGANALFVDRPDGFPVSIPNDVDVDWMMMLMDRDVLGVFWKATQGIGSRKTHSAALVLGVERLSSAVSLGGPPRSDGSQFLAKLRKGGPRPCGVPTSRRLPKQSGISTMVSSDRK